MSVWSSLRPCRSSTTVQAAMHHAVTTAVFAAKHDKWTLCHILGEECPVTLGFCLQGDHCKIKDLYYHVGKWKSWLYWLFQNILPHTIQIEFAHVQAINVECRKLNRFAGCFCHHKKINKSDTANQDKYWTKVVSEALGKGFFSCATLKAGQLPSPAQQPLPGLQGPSTSPSQFQ